MLWTICVVLLVLWVLGLLGGIAAPSIHLLLGIALVIVIVQLAQGRKPFS